MTPSPGRSGRFGTNGPVLWRGEYALGGDMTAALRDNCSDWADDMARHSAKFLVECRLRQRGLDGDGDDGADDE